MSDEHPISAGILKRIRDIQRAKGLSAAAMARQAGIQRDRMYRLLDGQPFTVDDVWRLAAGLGLAPSDLLPLDAATGLTDIEAAVLEAVRVRDPRKLADTLTALDLRVTGEPNPSIDALAAARELRASAETIRAAADGIDRAARSLTGPDARADPASDPDA